MSLVFARRHDEMHNSDVLRNIRAEFARSNETILRTLPDFRSQSAGTLVDHGATS
jgi:hypothetical protein